MLGRTPIGIPIGVLALVFSMVLGCQAAPVEFIVTPTPTQFVESTSISPMHFPGINTFGRGNQDSLNSTLALSDGRLVSVGWTISLSGWVPSWPNIPGSFVMITQPDGTSTLTRYGYKHAEEHLADLAEATNGDIIVVGGRYSIAGRGPLSDTEYGASISEIDSTGSPIWTHVYGGIFDHFSSVATSPDGSIYACGSTGDIDGVLWPSDVHSYNQTIVPIVAKLTSQGELVWVKNLGLDFVSAIVSAPNGDIVIAGAMSPAPDQPDNCRRNGQCPTLLRILPSSDVVFTTAFWPGDLTPYTISTPSDIAVDNSGEIVMVGSQNDFDAYVIKFSADGAMTWSRVFYPNYVSSDVAFISFSSVAFSPSGDIIVSGMGRLPGSAIALRSGLVASFGDSGNVRWYQCLGEYIYNWFSSVSVSPDGTIAAVGAVSNTVYQPGLVDTAALFARLAADGSIN